MAHAKKSQLKRPRNAMPPWVRQAVASRGLMEAYRARPPYQRNDYLGWITRAKLPETRTRRLEQMLDELAGGTLYMKMRWRVRREWSLRNLADPPATPRGSDTTRSHANDMLSVTHANPKTVDQYITAFPREVQAILRKIRQVVRSAAPSAEEGISYRMPAFRLNGPLVYFAAFTKHVGFYPPVRADSRLQKAVAPYAGDKGNLRFPLDRPIPYALIARITKLRVKQNLAKGKAARAGRKRK